MYKWTEIDEQRYDDMLNVLPPAIWLDHGFMVGEAWTHDHDGRPMFGAFVKYHNRYYECLQPMTVREFRKLNAYEIACQVDEAYDDLARCEAQHYGALEALRDD